MTRATGVVLVRSGAKYRVRTAEGDVMAVLRGRVRRTDAERGVPGGGAGGGVHAEGPAAVGGGPPPRSGRGRPPPAPQGGGDAG